MGNDTDGWTQVLNIGRQNKPWTSINATLPPKLNPSKIRVRHVTQDGHGTGDWGSAVDDMKIIATVSPPPEAYNSAEVVSPVFDISTYDAAKLKFWHKFGVETSRPATNDVREVYYSTNGGTSWIALADYNSSSQDWAQANLDLPPNANRVKFVFDTKDGKKNNYFGWALDDVKIVGSTTTVVPPTAPDNLRINTDAETGSRSMRLYIDKDAALSANAPVKINVEYTTFDDANKNGIRDNGEATTGTYTRVYGGMTDSNGRANTGGTSELDNGVVGTGTGTIEVSNTKDWVADDYFGVKQSGTDYITDTRGGTDTYQPGYLAVGEGRTGGSYDNPFTKLLKFYIDSSDFEDILRHNMFQDVFITSVSQDSYGDMLSGKLILNWDWKKRRTKIFQASFFSLYHS